MEDPWTQDLNVALRAALAGATVGLAYFARAHELTSERKGDGSLVTEADRTVESTVKQVLVEARPTDAFLGEETGESGHGPRRWILDGIDGTSVFVRGDNRWQSLIALEVDRQVVVAVCIVPAQGRIWYAARGHGAFVARFDGDIIAESHRITVGSGNAGTDAPRISILPPFASLPEEAQSQARKVLNGARETSWSAHAALLVAQGEMDLAIQFGGFLWDYAALTLIVEEAGGVTRDANGQHYPFEGTALFSRDPHVIATARRRL